MQLETGREAAVCPGLVATVSKRANLGQRLDVILSVFVTRRCTVGVGVIARRRSKRRWDSHDQEHGKYKYENDNASHMSLPSYSQGNTNEPGNWFPQLAIFFSRPSIGVQDMAGNLSAGRDIKRGTARRRPLLDRLARSAIGDDCPLLCGCNSAPNHRRWIDSNLNRMSVESEIFVTDVTPTLPKR